MTSPQRPEIVRLMENDRFAEAAALAHSALAAQPDDRDMLRLLAQCCFFAGYVAEAEKCFQQDLAAGPHAVSLTGMALIAGARGDRETAKALTREALKLDPGHPDAWTELAATHRFRAEDPLIRKAERLLKRKDLPRASEAAIAYALSEAMDQLGRHNRAWDYAARAGRAANGHYDPAAMSAVVAEMGAAFDRAFLAPRDGRGVASEAPIFVLGMPRSGTSLVEAILAATGAVTPMGELPTLRDITRTAIREGRANGLPESNFGWTRAWDDSRLTGAGEDYLSDVARRAGGTLPGRFVDKMPGNVFHLGIIGLLFPKARIVLVERDPLDTCCSCFLGRFGTGHGYSTRIDWLAHAAQCFRAAGAVLLDRLPNPVHRLRYEDLVTAPEAEIRRLTGFLGIDYSPACLTPGAGQISLTRSRYQIREAISDRSVGRWQRYRDRIGALAEALGIAIKGPQDAPPRRIAV